MGTIAPNPYVTKEVYDAFINGIMNPTLEGIKAEGMNFAGVIFFGLMITDKGVYLLEYNMRMGDPETQVVLPLLESDFIELLESGLKGDLANADVKWSNKSACCVVLASGGYPEAYNKGYEITGIDKVDNMVFVAGAKAEDGKLLTSGGRVLNVVAVGDNLEDARAKAYADAEKIDFTGKYCRKDIGVLYR